MKKGYSVIVYLAGLILTAINITLISMTIQGVFNDEHVFTIVVIISALGIAGYELTVGTRKCN